MICRLLNPPLLTSLAAAILTIATQIQLTDTFQLNHVVFAVFFGTYIYYNIHSIYLEIVQSKEIISVFSLKVLIVCLGLIVSLFYSSSVELIILISISLVTALYSFPYLHRITIFFNLRSVPYIKSFFVVLIWSIVTTILPIINIQAQIETSSLLSIFVGRTFFLLAIIIPFDIRDMLDDRKLAIKTIPLLVGYKPAMMLANVCLCIYVIFSLIFYVSSHNLATLIANIFSFIITLFILNIALTNKKVNYFNLMLDGMIFLQGLLIVIFFYLSKLVT
jgi:4-hydroxybenzoate polyprenyltransferase